MLESYSVYTFVALVVYLPMTYGFHVLCQLMSYTGHRIPMGRFRQSNSTIGTLLKSQSVFHTSTWPCGRAILRPTRNR
jgi:hypothetical protein